MRLLFCGSGWLPIVDHIAARLSEGSTIVRWDRTQPLVEVVRDIDVLLPSNAPITADVRSTRHAPVEPPTNAKSREGAAG